jgi:O-antigen/teichoic acid export membrane protein
MKARRSGGRLLRVTDVRTNAELTRATAHGLRWSTLARVATEVLLLASSLVLARLIPPSAFGMFAVAVIVQELAVTVPSEGVGSALVQRDAVERAHLQAGLALTLLVGVGLVAATLLACVLVVRPVFGAESATLVALTTPWFPLGAIAALPMTVLRRRLDFRRLALLGLVQSVVRTATSILLAAVAGLDASALVFGALAGMAAMVALALAFAPVPLPRWRTRAVRDLLPYGGPAMVACFSWAGFRNGDYAIVGARLGTAQAGIYWRGFQLAVEYQSKVSAVMNQVAFPVLARAAGPDEMFALRRRMVRLLTVVIFPLLASLAVLAPVVVPWMFGPSWEPAVLPTQILTGAGAATVVIDAVGTVLMATGRARAMLGYGVAHFVVYAGAVLVASRHGLVGVCVAAVSVHALFLVVAYQVLLHGRAERTLRFLWDDVSAATVSCLALAGAAVPLQIALDGAPIPAVADLLLVGGAGLLAYLGVLRVAFPADWRDLLALVRRIMPARRMRARKLPRAAAVQSRP